MATSAPPNTGTEPFPPISTSSPPSPRDPPSPRTRGESTTSTLQGRLRSASKTFAESSPPTGFCVATGQIASSIPSLEDIRRGSYGSEGWSGEGQFREKERRASLGRRGSSDGPSTPIREKRTERQESVPEVPEAEIATTTGMDGIRESERSTTVGGGSGLRSSSDTNLTPNASAPVKSGAKPEYRTEPFDNGYQFPPKHTWQESTSIGLLATWKFVTSPIGFLVTIYGLNVVAWGGMLFLLLCNASPAMCKPTCNDINSPRRVWIEIDSQILNALFCVTGFGTIPWRFRDLYYLMQYRIQKNEVGLRRLAGINRGWFRLAGSHELPVSLGPGEVETELTNVPESSIPFPITKLSNAPPTGIRAPATPVWKLDFVIWAMVWNTFLQAVLSGFMWGLNRIDRPSWSTGLFVALACIVAACGGIMEFIEGKKVKAIEGVPVSEKDLERLKQDRERGVLNWNNIKAAPPKEKKEKAGLFKRSKAEKVAVGEGAMEEGAATAR